MAQLHPETEAPRLVLAFVASIALGTLLTVLWILAGWTNFAPVLSEGMTIYWPAITAWLGVMSLFTGPLVFVLVALFYWLPGVILVAAPCWGIIHRRGYRQSFHLATLGAALAAIYSSFTLGIGGLAGAMLLGPPCWWFANRDGQQNRIGPTISGLILGAILIFVWPPLAALGAGELLGHGSRLFLLYNAGVMSIVGAIVGHVTWSIAYRVSHARGSEIRSA
jgi:hypothetical protein